ncbi:MarR family transcriptional regulator [Candidatus Peregrinibacteria bacterium]|nr:MarR family transcriptional regulator [Candidatus Peregrinibacteria bacterium]
MSREKLLADIFDQIALMRKKVFMSHMHKPHTANMPTRAQMGVLFFLSHDQNSGVKEMGKCMGMSTSAATQLVNGLVEQGYVSRKPDLKDRRKVALVITAKARKIIQKMNVSRVKALGEMFEPLNSAELKVLNKILQKIVNQPK